MDGFVIGPHIDIDDQTAQEGVFGGDGGEGMVEDVVLVQADEETEEDAEELGEDGEGYGGVEGGGSALRGEVLMF